MWRSLFSPVSAHAHRRSVWLGLSSAGVQRTSRLLKREWGAVKPAAKFALQLTVGAAALAGTILALFAWSGAGL